MIKKIKIFILSLPSNLCYCITQSYVLFFLFFFFFPPVFLQKHRHYGSKHIGSYDTQIEAAKAYDRAIVEHRLPRSKMNFPNELYQGVEKVRKFFQFFQFLVHTDI